MKKLVLHFRNSLVLICLLSVVIPAQSGSEHFFTRGNQAYRNGNYQEALQHYQQIVDAGYEDSELYYNIGNCFYKLNQIGMAIWYYEKARKLDPQDEEILFNLKLANTRVIDRIEMPPRFFLFEWWDALKYSFTTNEITRLVCIFYVVTMGLLSLFILARFFRFRKTLLTLFGLFAFLTLFSGYLLFLNVRENHELKKGILLTPSVNVLSAPDQQSTDVFVLHEGAKVILSEQRNDWVKISLPDGKSGWVREDHLGVI